MLEAVFERFYRGHRLARFFKNNRFQSLDFGFHRS